MGYKAANFKSSKKTSSYYWHILWFNLSLHDIVHALNIIPHVSGTYSFLLQNEKQDFNRPAGLRAGEVEIDKMSMSLFIFQAGKTFKN